MLDLNVLREEIAARGLEWRPEPTAIAERMGRGEGAGLFGLAISEPEIASQMMSAVARPRTLAAAAPPPPRIDWRSHNGANYVSPIKDQGACGACVAFATCASIEARLSIQNAAPGNFLDLSEAHLFFCGAGQACQIGWNYRPALSFCQTTGVGAEAAWPYQPIDQACRTIVSVAQIHGWTEEALMNERKAAIAHGGPVIAGMRVYEDFGYYRGGVYRHVMGTSQGLHAVCVVGYDDVERCWIVKNSWGGQWGESGFFRIGYGECGIDANFVFYCPSV